MVSTFNPIAPRQAAGLVEQASLGDAAQVLVDFAAAGLVKGYARLIETLDPADRTEVRDSRVSRDLWRRIAAAGKSDQVLSAMKIVLEAGPADPAVEITGIRFDDVSLQAVIGQHTAAARPYEPSPRPRRVELDEPATVTARESAPAVQPLTPRPTICALPEGAVLVTVNQAMAALGIKRTKVNDLMGKGTLVRVKIDTRTLITTESIRALLP